MSDFLQMKLVPTVPAVGIDMFGAIISYGLLEYSHISDYVIVINTEIIDAMNSEENGIFKGHFS